MKKYSLRTIIIISLVIFIFPAWAQVEVDLGVIGGANLSNLSIDPVQGWDISTSSRTGLAIGALLVLNLNPMIAIQIEPKYMQSGANFTAEQDGFKIEGSNKVVYTNTPLLLKLSFGTETFKPYIIAGGYSGLRLSSKQKIDKATFNGQDVTNQIPSEEIDKDIKDQTKSIDMGLNFGAGVTIPAGNVQLLFQADYSLGLINIDTNNDDPENVEAFPQGKKKNRGIQLKAGLVFPIGR